MHDTCIVIINTWTMVYTYVTVTYKVTPAQFLKMERSLFLLNVEKYLKFYRYYGTSKVEKLEKKF